MRKSRFSESQIVEILKKLEGGVAVADLLRKHSKGMTQSAKRHVPERLVQEHQPPVVRACRAVRLSRAACYRPPMSATRQDAPVIAILTNVIARCPRWGVWKCFDRMRNEGHRLSRPLEV